MKGVEVEKSVNHTIGFKILTIVLFALVLVNGRMYAENEQLDSLLLLGLEQLMDVEVLSTTKTAKKNQHSSRHDHLHY